MTPAAAPVTDGIAERQTAAAATSDSRSSQCSALLTRDCHVRGDPPDRLRAPLVWARWTRTKLQRPRSTGTDLRTERAQLRLDCLVLDGSGVSEGLAEGQCAADRVAKA